MNKAARIIDENKNNDFNVIAALKKEGYKYETENLINTIIESTYKLKVFNDKNELKAEAIFRSEDATGTTLTALDWY